MKENVSGCFSEHSVVMLLHKSGMLYLWISANHHQSFLSNVI